MIGTDDLTLFGIAPRPSRRLLKAKPHVISPSQERAFLIHETWEPPLSNHGIEPNPSRDLAFNSQIRKRFFAPRWSRVFQLDGDVAVTGREGHVLVDGKLFKPPNDNQTLRPYRRRHSVFHKLQMLGKDMPRLDQAILLRHPFDYNYFHRLHDVLTRLPYADDLGLDRSIPVIVSKTFADSLLGTSYIQSPLFKGREVVVQPPDQTIRCKRLYCIKPPQFDSDLLKRVSDALPESAVDGLNPEKLVLIRDLDVNDPRQTIGYDALKSEVTRRGYVPLDPAILTPEQQKWVFGRTRHVVCENGAGLINMIHGQHHAMRIDSIVLSRFASVTFAALGAATGHDTHLHLIPSQKKHAKVIVGQIDQYTCDRILDSTDLPLTLPRKLS